MPLPGQFQTGRSESEDLEEAFALSLVEESGPDAHNPEPPQSGISFAHMTRMGYAATGRHPKIHQSPCQRAYVLRARREMPLPVLVEHCTIRRQNVE